MKNHLNIFVFIILLLTLSEFGKAEEMSVLNFGIRDFNADRRNWAITQDNRGLMYFGNEDGVLEYDGATWRLISLPGESGVYSLAVGKDGRIFVGGNGDFGCLAPDDHGTMEFISMANKLPESYRQFEGRIYNISVGSEGVIFLTDKLLIYYIDESIQVIRADDYYFSSTMLNSTFYVADGEGLFKLEAGVLLPVVSDISIRSNYLLPYKDSQILSITQNRGIETFNPTEKTLKFIPLSDLETEKFKNLELSTAEIFSNGNIAVGTVNQGVIILEPDGKQFKSFNISSGLGCGNVLDIFEDRQMNLWLALECGISLISNTGIFEDGFPEKADINSLIREVEGLKNDSLIFGGAFFDVPGGVHQLDQPESMIFKFPYDYNAFRFAFSSNFYDTEKKLQFQTKLEGLDDDWAKWSSRTSREYTNLYWGKYIFHVNTRLSDETIGKPASYIFIIETPWFESWWFYGTQVIILFLLLTASGLLARMGKALKLSNYLTTIVVLVLFKYFHMALAPYIGHVSAGIAFFKIVTSVVIGFIINPAQEITQKSMRKILGTKKDK
jgi:hypothetical protein